MVSVRVRKGGFAERGRIRAELRAGRSFDIRAETVASERGRTTYLDARLRLRGPVLGVDELAVGALGGPERVVHDARSLHLLRGERRVRAILALDFDRRL